MSMKCLVRISEKDARYETDSQKYDRERKIDSGMLNQQRDKGVLFRGRQVEHALANRRVMLGLPKCQRPADQRCLVGLCGRA